MKLKIVHLAVKSSRPKSRENMYDEFFTQLEWTENIAKCADCSQIRVEQWSELCRQFQSELGCGTLRTRVVRKMAEIAVSRNKLADRKKNPPLATCSLTFKNTCNDKRLPRLPFVIVEQLHCFSFNFLENPLNRI